VNRRDTRVCWQVNKGGLSEGWERGCVVVSDFIGMYNNAW
jgi:6-phosphogluconate dehydrogenase